MQALCVGRHAFLADHISAFFRAIGLVAEPAVGLNAAISEARRRGPDLVVCDYDLLTPSWLGTWRADELVSGIPLVAVSLTRRAEEVNLGSLPGVTDFLYLPTLDRETALRVIGRVRRAVAAPPGGGYDRPNQVIATPAP
jgi:DNA-binding response OmpR family regulator